MQDADLLSPGEVRPEDRDRTKSGHDAQRLRGDVPGHGRGHLRDGDARLARVVQTPQRTQQDSRALLRGRSDAPRGRGSEFDRIRPARCGRGARRLRFDVLVDTRGYSWWYVDALSDDGQHGLTVIGFIGSVFSPYYAWSDWRTPEEHCAINVALYGPKGRWAMTERGAASLGRDADHLRVGPSQMRWEDGGLTIEFDEIGCPIPRRVKGVVRVEPEWTNETGFSITDHHAWWPIAPRARVRAELDAPDLAWDGHGYLDSNWGTQPLQEGFVDWNWSRTGDESSTFITYDCHCRDGSGRAIALAFDASGELSTFEPPEMRALDRTFWRVARHGRGEHATVVQTLEDTPFYTRSVLETELRGKRVKGMHESLSLDRFASPVVRLMLPFRMPRAAFRPRALGGGPRGAISG